MSVEPSILIFAVMVFGGYAVQTVTGFGSGLILVTLGALLFDDITEAITLIVPISLLQTSYIAFRHRDGIDLPLLIRRIVPFMGAGCVVGYYGLRRLEGAWLLTAFGVLVLLLSLRELYSLVFAKDRASRTISRGASTLSLIGAGLVHGVYTTGGPLLVYALAREGLTKHVFRSTITAVWVVLSLALVIAFAVDGRYDADVGANLLVLIPGVPLGILLGEWLHKKIDERRFNVALFALLAVLAIVLVVR